MKTSPLIIAGIALAVAMIATGLINFFGLPFNFAAVLGICAGIAVGTYVNSPEPEATTEPSSEPPPASLNHDASALGAFAILAFLAGAVLIVMGLTMETSVSTSIGMVHNLALGEERMIWLGGGAVALIIGAIFTVAAAVKK